MSSQTFRAGDIQGLTPALDAWESDKIFALEGENFIFDSIGPKSSLGNRVLLPQARENPAHSQGFRFNYKGVERCFTMDSDGIWEWNEQIGGWQSIYLTGDISATPSRWTFGFLVDLVYLCHPRVGLLVLDPQTNVCLPHSTAGIGTPSSPLSITINNGRLCVLDPLFFSWSNPSNGLDFTPKLGGAGFQLLSDKVSGQSVALTSYPGGCLSWTTGGVLRSEFTGDSAVYRHRSLSTEYRPVNSFCSVRIDADTTVILDERGLFQTKGDSPTPYAPIFNEFLIKYIRANKLQQSQNLRIEWDELQRLLYISVSLTYAAVPYDFAFVYYPPLDKWSTFNERHFGILPWLMKDSAREGRYSGFVDAFGVARYWLETASREELILTEGQEDANLYYPVVQLAAAPDPYDEGWIMPSVAVAEGFDSSGVLGRAGFYKDGRAVPKASYLTGLGARIQYGWFRPLQNQSSDQMAEAVNVLIRADATSLDDEIIYDLELLAGVEDLELLSGVEDCGLQILPFRPLQLRYAGSNDGSSEFMSVAPEMVRFYQGARYYALGVVGVCHKIEIKAEEVGESFHLHSGEITAVNAGRLL